MTTVEPELRRSYRCGDALLRIPAPAQATDQAPALPGTAWRQEEAGCELVVTDAVSYAKFVVGAPAPGHHLRHRRQGRQG